MKNLNIVDISNKLEKYNKENKNLKKNIKHYVSKIDKLQEKLKRKNKLIEKLRYQYREKLGIKRQLVNCLKNKTDKETINKQLTDKLNSLQQKVKENKDKTKIVYILKYSKVSKKIIDYLKKEHKSDSSKLSKKLGYSRNYISEVCNLLYKKDILVKQQKKISKRGRPKIRWKLNYERYL